MSSNFGRLCRDVIAGSLQIKSQMVIDKNANLIVNNGTVKGNLVVNGSISSDNVSQVIFRPGYVGPPIVGVYSDWAELMAVFAPVYGPKTIILDATSGPLVIPPGAWNMTSITLVSYICTLQIPSLIKLVTVQDGATLHGLCGIQGPLLVNYEGTTEPCVVMNSTLNPNNAGFLLDYGANLSCSGSQPFIYFTGTDPSELILNVSAGLETSSTPVVHAATGTQMYIIGLGNISKLQDNTVSSDVGSTTLIIIGSNSFSADLNLAVSQPDIMGSTAVFSLVQNSPYIFRRLVNPTVSDDENIGAKSGDIWINTTTDDIFICANSSPGSAIWKIV
jgi:hypothetical protein